MIIQFYDEDLDYVNRKIMENVGQFLDHFLHACLHADDENYELLRPVLHQIAKKYPLRPKPRGGTFEVRDGG